MSTFSRRLAAFVLALLAAGGALAEAPASAADRPALARLRSIEFETALAREPKIYLVLDPQAKHLDIKSRAMVLERIAIDALLLLEFEPLFSQAESPELSAPTLWKVTQGPGDTDRETIAPVALRPYSEEEEKEEPAAPAAAGAPAAPAKKKPDETTIPSSYRATLDNGWQLYVTADAPQSSFFRRLVASVRDGWQRLRGKEPQHPPLITLVVAPAAAQRLHHLIRSGTEILVLP
ncbi:MAG: hypothetical protein QG573_263 [Acidobacteriota bacterium]|nr:hypothetical protein [Acidobacteriota bacterium]